MKPKSQRFSLFDRIVHETTRGFKELLKEGHDQVTLSKNIQDLELKSLKDLLKVGAFYLALSFSMMSSGPSKIISIPTPIGKLDLPLSISIFIASAALAGICLGLIKFAVLTTTKSIIAHKVQSKSRFIAGRSVAQGDENSDITSPLRVGTFIKLQTGDTIGVFGIYGFIFTLSILPLVFSLPTIISAIFLGIYQIDGINLESAVIISSSLLLFSSLVYLILFFTPLDIKPDRYKIRYGLLYQIGKDEKGLHPRSFQWAREDNPQK
ncbi:hypothetical protein [Loktanella salsilacus]|uniref:hypothetical protein n=1 Tax=Loktanella salsilacus TaxID=195913 RepID=UPI0020B880BB|nr:hypothetical protein [Loktanella salsilacus]UTH49007.1 hypothetical protein KBW81_04200 [Loktanella salsilacus]